MKITLPIIALSVLLVGCLNPTQQTIALQSISALEVATTAVYDGYLTEVVQGKVATNNLPKVSHDYNSFQKAMTAAAVAAGGTNAVAPGALQMNSFTLTNFINSIPRK